MNNKKIEQAIEAVETAQKFYAYPRVGPIPGLAIALTLLRELSPEPECETCGDKPLQYYYSKHEVCPGCRRIENPPACSQPPTEKPPITLHDIQSQPEEDIWNEHVTPKPESFLRPTTNKCTLCMGHRDRIDSCKHCGGTGKEPKAEVGECTHTFEQRGVDICEACLIDRIDHLKKENEKSKEGTVSLAKEINRLEDENKQWQETCEALKEHLHRLLTEAKLAKAAKDLEAEDFEQWFTMEGQNFIGHNYSVEDLCKLVWEARQEELSKMDAHILLGQKGCGTCERISECGEDKGDLEICEKWECVSVQTYVNRREAQLTEAKQDAEAFENSLRQKKAAFDGCRAGNRELKAELTDIRLELSSPLTAGLEKEPLYKWAATFACEIHHLKAECKQLQTTNHSQAEELTRLKRALGEE